MKTETPWHNTGQVCLTEVCRDWFIVVLMVATSEGLGGAKKKLKGEEGERRGLKQQTAKWHRQDNTQVCWPAA